MNNLYEQFNCTTKEELYKKIRNDDSAVNPLLEFMDFAKANIRNKNKAITSPEIFTDYVQSIKMPTKDTGTIIFVDTKNHPVLLKRTRLSRKNDIKEALKEGLTSGGARAFIAFNEDTPTSRTEELNTLFEKIGMRIVDSLGYSKANNVMRSNTAGRPIYLSQPQEIIKDKNSEYTKDDFSVAEEYTEFSSYFAKNELLGMNIINDSEGIKEQLKVGFQHHNQEVFGMCAYDQDEKIILVEELFKGGTDASVVDLRIIAKELLQLEDLKGVSIFHNHPSGVPDPSNEDISITNRISKMCGALGVEFLDHHIVGKERVLSFAQEMHAFKSDNHMYQDKVRNRRGVSEKNEGYPEEKETSVLKQLKTNKSKTSNRSMNNDKQLVEISR